ncbi:MAG: CPBP family intramembrane metalloprotease [Oscillospiraceae bacterium]|nr:CPBP family intramembrane metalloprotease [Oscillospiraceae bacterium]
MEKRHNKEITFILGTYILCYFFRLMEYMFIRTDRTILGEAFIHKVLGILVLVIALRHLHYRWRDIGFVRSGAVRGVFVGLLIGVATFVIAYGVEMTIQQMNGNAPTLRIYISSFSIAGNNVMQTSVLFFAMCIAGNMINVVMEEGIFRGLFVKLFESKVSFTVAMLLSSLLFGVWHIAAPLREFLDGNMQTSSFIMAALMQVLLTGLMGIMLCLLVKIAGSIWTAMAVHFVNNFVVNILHVVTLSGADELQVIRISVAQTITFIGILIVYIAKKSYQKNTFR